MGGKHGKYAYVRRKDGMYVKLRLLKSRDEKEAERYIVIGPVRKTAPFGFEVLNEEDLPEQARAELYKV
ncbi:MAG: DUF5622 domain-containing protein [Acidilobaceae archaeon]|nr:DUF5622 domain-containing protein [Acidilobaceae archaeon]